MSTHELTQGFRFRSGFSYVNVSIRWMTLVMLAGYH